MCLTDHVCYGIDKYRYSTSCCNIMKVRVTCNKYLSILIFYGLLLRRVCAGCAYSVGINFLSPKNVVLLERPSSVCFLLCFITVGFRRHGVVGVGRRRIRLFALPRRATLLSPSDRLLLPLDAGSTGIFGFLVVCHVALS